MSEMENVKTEIEKGKKELKEIIEKGKREIIELINYTKNPIPTSSSTLDLSGLLNNKKELPKEGTSINITKHSPRKSIVVKQNCGPENQKRRIYIWPPSPEDPKLAKIFESLKEFATSDLDSKKFEKLDENERKYLHNLASKYGFCHTTQHNENQNGEILESYVTIEKVHKKGELITAPNPSPTNQKNDLEDEKKIYELIEKFVKQSTEKTYKFPSTLTSTQRKIVHNIAEKFELDHDSLGGRDNRYIQISKVDPAELENRREQAKILREALHAYELQILEESKVIVPITPVIPTQRKQSLIRFMQWNIEWFDHLFESDKEFKKTDKENHIDDVQKLCRRIAGVIQEIDPDVLSMQEGPSTLKRMVLFCETYLDNAYHVYGALDEGQIQQLFILVKKNGPVKNCEYYEPSHKYLNNSWKFDVNGDTTLKDYKFTRVPLIVKGTINLNNKDRSFFACSLHTKSKYVPGGERMWKSNDIKERQQFIKTSIKNRRRIAAECMRVRKCLDETIFAKHQDPLIVVSGDINDSVGMDFFEEFYLLFDSTEALVGSQSHKKRMLYSQMIKQEFVKLDQQWSVIFDDYIDDIRDRKVLLDHVFVSEAVDSQVKNASVAHDIFGKYCETNWKGERGNRPSDHKPVFVDLF